MMLMVLSGSFNYQTMIVYKSLATDVGGEASTALMVGDKSWDLTPLVGIAFIIQTNKM